MRSVPLPAAGAGADIDPGRGMALMASAMLIAPGMDAIAKLLATDLPPFQVGFLRFLLQTVLLGGVLLLGSRRRAFAVPRAAMPKLALAGALIGLAIGFLFWSLASLPLANAIAIFFVEPLILTLFSALFLREAVGWHRLSAVGVGLVGAMIVIRPNWANFGWVALLPLLAAVFYAGQLTVIRSITAQLSGLRVLFYSGAFATLFLGLALLAGDGAGAPHLSWKAPPRDLWGLVLGLGVLSAVSHLMITTAFRMTQASILAPFQYLEIISATIFGYLIFGDFPDILTWLGTAIILAAGIYVFHRERRQARGHGGEDRAPDLAKIENLTGRVGRATRTGVHSSK